MSALKTAVSAAESKPNDLLNDLLEAVHEQYKQDGSTHCTPLNSDKLRRESLTEKWAGTIIAAKVLDGSPVHIIKQGDEPILEDVSPDYEPGKHFAPKSFPEMAGIIEVVSPAYGGYIALDRSWSIALPTSVNRQLPAEELGLEITILAEN